MKSAADLVQEHLLYMTTDLTQWRALYDENAVWEFAYASSAGLPGAARGIMEIAQRVEGFLARVERLSFGALQWTSGEIANRQGFRGRRVPSAAMFRSSTNVGESVKGIDFTKLKSLP